MIPLVSLLGALTILAAYAANQFGWLKTSNFSYALANALGAGVLTAVACGRSSVSPQPYGWSLPRRRPRSDSISS